MATATRTGRPREFREDDVLEAAMRLFWDRGYHATSVADLTAVTGLHKGSLYGAFGDKHALFVAALRRYGAQNLARMDAELADPSPLAGLRRYLRQQAEQAAGTASARGCLMANSALELLPGDTEVAAVVAAHHRAVTDRLAGALDRARAAGELPAARTGPAQARFLFTVVEGLWELGRTTTDPEPLRDVVESALRAVT
jgi:TetR/AcrR family transcriptional repressor of nem operon